jgi:MFS superfamily sulfate permease-like transporter
MLKDKSNLMPDFLASIVVFLVALPLCLGIAIASGVPPAAGLITGIIGGILVGVLAGSPLQVSGPAAGLAVIVWDLVNRFGVDMLGPIVLVAGLIQLAAGLLKWGQYFRAIAPPVIYGMLAGIGVLIFAGQFHVMVDDKPKGSGLLNLISIPDSIYKGVFTLDGSSHHMAAFIGLLTIAIIAVWPRVRPRRFKYLPAPLIAVAVAAAASSLMKLPIKLVDVPSNLLDAAVWPTAATLGKLANADVLITALALALIASAETLLCAVAVDRMHTGPGTDFDRELAAHGVGNLLCGVAGALPMTGVIVRSTANIDSGAKTRTSAILHGFWLLALVAVFPQVLRMIPTSCLAAVLVFTGYKLVNPDNIRALAKFGRVPVAIYFATLTGIVVTDLLTGVIIGVVLTLIRLIHSVTHIEMRMEFNENQNRADLFLEGSATFLTLPRLAAHLDKIPRGAELHVHVDRLLHIDHACMDALHGWEKRNEQFGSTLVVEWEDLVARYHRITIPDNGGARTKESGKEVMAGSSQ